MSLSKLVQRASTLALVGVVVGAAHSIVHEPIKLRPDAPLPLPAPAANGEPSPQVLGLEITLAQAWDLFGKGAPFVDARRSEDFEAGHIEGALWIAPESFMGGLPEVANYLDREAPLVIYCTGGDCDASHNVAAMLNQAGFKRCHILKEGYPAWVAAGHPIAAGKGGMP